MSGSRGTHDLGPANATPLLALLPEIVGVLRKNPGKNSLHMNHFPRVSKRLAVKKVCVPAVSTAAVVKMMGEAAKGEKRPTSSVLQRLNIADSP